MNQDSSHKEVCTAAQIYQKLIDAGIKKASGKIKNNYRLYGNQYSRKTS